MHSEPFFHPQDIVWREIQVYIPAASIEAGQFLMAVKVKTVTCLKCIRCVLAGLIYHVTREYYYEYEL